MNGFHLAVLQRISSLIGDAGPVTMFVTSSHWGRIADEVGMAPLADPGNRPTPLNFHSMWVGKNLLVVNSTSEDQDAVNLANQLEAERTGFAWKRENLRTG